MESFDSNAKKVLSRRGVILSFLMLLPFPILVSRLFYLQNVVGSRFKALAEENRLNIRLLRPPRGRFLDRFGITLAEDKSAYRLVLIPEQCPEPKRILSLVARLIPLSDQRIEQILSDIKRRAPFTPITVMSPISFDDLARVQSNLPDLPGIDLKIIPFRFYEKSTMLSHLLGYVGRSDYDKRKQGKAWAPDFPVGRQGLEQLYENRLSGVPGVLELETNAVGRPLRDVNRKEATPGEDMVLSLNMKIQEAAYDALHGETGSIVVMDVRTGGILAAVSHPTFDSNLFSDGIDPVKWKEILDNPENPLLNRTMQGLYSPGSTYKPLVALAALEEGVIPPEEKITCRGKIKFGNRDFHCWKKHGKVDMHESIKGSCDIYYYEVARRLGIDTLSKYADMFGFGHRSSIGLSEKEGINPNKAWKRKARRASWNEGETLNAGIGQGFMVATPLQMVTMAARIATGREIQPVLFTEQEIGNKKPKLPIKEEHLELVRKGMFSVVNEWGGTARRSMSKNFEIAGKTGTVQVVSERIDEDTPMSSVRRKKRPHGLFIAFAPYDQPQFAISVVVEHGGSGSGAAAPVAKAVLEAAFASQGVYTKKEKSA